MTHQRITTIAIALMATTAAVPAAAANPSTTSSVGEERFETTANQSIRGEQLETRFTFDTNAANLTAAYTYGDNVDHAFELQLHQLVEYEDGNDDGELGENDSIASNWRLSDEARNVYAKPNGTVEWRNLNTTTVTADGTEGLRVTATGDVQREDPLDTVTELVMDGENRTVTLEFLVFDEPVTYEGQELGPTTIGVDLHVTNYPYAANETRLALVSTADATTPVTETGNTSGLQATSEIPELAEIDLAFAWADEATVDDDTELVTASTHDADRDDDNAPDRLVTLNYARGDEIQHDAEFGADVRPLEASTLDDVGDEVSGVPAPSAIATIGALGALGLIARRRVR
jgi:hypothetical protein